MQCPKCHTEQPEGQSFCGSCGASMTSRPKRRGWIWGIVAGVVVLSLLSWGDWYFQFPPFSPTPTPAPTVTPTPVLTAMPLPTSVPISLPTTPVVYNVTYTVRGDTRDASLTYANITGATEQRPLGNKGALFNDRPWSMSFPANVGQFLYLSVQNLHDHGTIICEITVNGKMIQQAESKGGYAVATCSGSVEP